MKTQTISNNKTTKISLISHLSRFDADKKALDKVSIL